MACKRFTLAACTVRRDGLRPVKLRTAEGFTDMVVDAILRMNATDRRFFSSTSERSSENLTLILERRTLRNPFKFIPGRDPSCSAKAREIILGLASAAWPSVSIRHNPSIALQVLFQARLAEGATD